MKSLGKETKYRFDKPNKEVLQAVNNPHQDVNYTISLTCPEFTSICPITRQPDFAHLVIDYVADKKIIESKSLKLYLFSYRNHGAFHEDCTVQIAKDLISCIKPKWLRISGYWYPRGGIPIDIFYQTGNIPQGVFVREATVTAYKGRG
ncbi:MAG TPA: preQ(1) synthase [Rickettsiales bacterium]|nr:preQ(1) synthase [Rickettsiales bacterium]